MRGGRSTKRQLFHSPKRNRPSSSRASRASRLATTMDLFLLVLLTPLFSTFIPTPPHTLISLLCVTLHQLFAIHLLYCVVLFSHHISEANRDKTIDLIQTFRDYLHYHIKCSKAYMHTRMRNRVDSLLQVPLSPLLSCSSHDIQLVLIFTNSNAHARTCLYFHRF